MEILEGHADKSSNDNDVDNKNDNPNNLIIAKK